jgi:hypothetical protein
LLVGTNYYGIIKNGTTTLNTFVGLAAGTAVYGMDTILQVNDADMNITAKRPNSNARIQIEQCTIDATSYALVLGNSNVEVRIRDVLFKALSIDTDQQVNKVLFNRTHCLLSSDGIDDKGVHSVAVSYKFTSVRKSGTLGGTGIKLSTSDRLFQDVYIENFLYGVYCTNGKIFGNQSGTDLILDNCTYGFELRNGTRIIFTLLSVYIDGVDYTFSAILETLQWNVKVFIEDLNGTPDTATFHSSVDISATDATKDIYYIIT